VLAGEAENAVPVERQYEYRTQPGLASGDRLRARKQQLKLWRKAQRPWLSSNRFDLYGCGQVVLL
jgi:hypothetical protein